jgi:[acyl-carrier-protein] S-malonyltransferase
VNNVDVAQLTDAVEIKNALVRQSYSAVRWVETIQAMTSMGINTFIECGPGKALTGMVKRIAPDAVVHNVFDEASLQATLSALADVSETKE